MMSSQEALISFQDVSVRYRLPQERVSGLKEYTIRFLQRRVRYEQFWALKGVSFQVMPGEIFGIIGRNGAGKSTLLKVMARVLHPTRGRVILRGQIAPLLELGGGFHPELTGRENVYLNMALLGYTHRQTEELFDSIVAFAEIPDFIDAPLRTYSTGMVARLGFSVATCMQPEILLVDEVLSVGDTQFQQKCLQRMEDYQRQGTTIVIVSHSLDMIQTFCQRALWLKNGQVEAIGDVHEVVERYQPVLKNQVAISAIDKPYTALLPERQIYPAASIFNPQQGALSAWVRHEIDAAGMIAMLFHSEDSRFVTYIHTTYSSEFDQRFYHVTARAGGNQKAPGAGDQAEFPELSALLSAGSAAREWKHVVMTWEGFPDGRFKLYINGNQMGERQYSSRYNNQQPLSKNLALGLRPLNWPGELVENPDGTVTDLRPESTMSASDAGLEIRDVRLFTETLNAIEVQRLYAQGPAKATEMSPTSQTAG
jgi:ABC-2 type transport system ATP-binding protein